MAAGPEPGWYPDPLGADQQRWWDGVRWTASLRPVPPDPAAAEVTTTLPPVAGPVPTADVQARSAPAANVPAWPAPVADAQAWPAPAAEDGWAVTPTEDAGDEDRDGRRTSWIWAGAVAAVLAVALGVGVGLALRSPGADAVADGDPVASDPSPVTEAAIERPEPNEEPLAAATEPLETEAMTETETEADELSEEATEGTELEPPPPASEATEAEPETEATTDASTDAATGSGSSGSAPAQPPVATTPTSRPSAAELTGAASSYIAALDVGDFRWAHDHLTPEMQQRPGWTLTEFTEFWDGYLAAAEIISFDGIDDTTGAVSATVDYALQSGDLARESLRMTFVRGPGDRALMDEYEVLRSVWNP
jgi:ribonuclease E